MQTTERGNSPSCHGRPHLDVLEQSARTHGPHRAAVATGCHSGTAGLRPPWRLGQEEVSRVGGVQVGILVFGKGAAKG